MGQLLVTLIDRGKAVPYLSAGGGVYHASSERLVAPGGRPDADPRDARGLDRNDARPRTAASRPSPAYVRRIRPSAWAAAFAWTWVRGSTRAPTRG
jgi:hypothetical protein